MSEANNNPFEMKVQGTVVNEQNSPEELGKRLEFQDHLLGEGAKLVESMQSELKACRARLAEQETELAQLREELNKPTGA